MPHFPKPFFRTDRGLWYVQFKGKQFNLGPEQDSAFSRYHELMSRPPDESTTASDRPPGKAVVDLIDSFLDWCEKHREPRTYEYYQERCQSFVETIDLGMTVGQLKPCHVQQWVDGKDWNPGMKRGAMSAIQRAFNWAAKLGHIESSPIAFMEKPPQGRREVVIPAATYQATFRTIVPRVVGVSHPSVYRSKALR